VIRIAHVAAPIIAGGGNAPGLTSRAKVWVALRADALPTVAREVVAILIRGTGFEDVPPQAAATSLGLIAEQAARAEPAVAIEVARLARLRRCAGRSRTAMADPAEAIIAVNAWVARVLDGTDAAIVGAFVAETIAVGQATATVAALTAHVRPNPSRSVGEGIAEAGATRATGGVDRGVGGKTCWRVCGVRSEGIPRLADPALAYASSTGSPIRKLPGALAVLARLAGRAGLLFLGLADVWLRQTQRGEQATERRGQRAAARTSMSQGAGQDIEMLGVHGRPRWVTMAVQVRYGSTVHPLYAPVYSEYWVEARC
jgi:hypothetical protein